MRVQITVPPNTPKNNPQVTRLQYGSGSMRMQSIKFPDAKCYLRGLQMYAGHQSGRIIPEMDSNTDWLVDNGRTIVRNIPLDFSEPSFEVVFKCYNEDDSFEHSFYIDLE